MKTVKLFYIALLPLLTVTSLAAATVKSGTIVDETWKKADSPFILDGDILVASLTIEQGITILASNNAVFEVAGVLTATGTATEPIRFTKVPSAVGWQGIFFNYSGDGSELRYCSVSESTSGGIRIVSSSPHLIFCCLTNNSSTDHGAGLKMIEGSSVVEDCEVSGNLATGMGGGIYRQGGRSRL